MKKYFIALMMLVIGFGMVACGQGQGDLQDLIAPQEAAKDADKDKAEVKSPPEPDSKDNTELAIAPGLDDQAVAPKIMIADQPDDAMRLKSMEKVEPVKAKDREVEAHPHLKIRHNMILEEVGFGMKVTGEKDKDDKDNQD